jgi:hypothetical protein
LGIKKLEGVMGMMIMRMRGRRSGNQKFNRNVVNYSYYF